VDGPVRWYGVANSDQAALEMAQEIQAFVGPSYSDFSGQFCSLSTNDPIESALEKRFGNSVIRFEPSSRDDVAEIQKQLSLYQRLLARRPAVVERGQRPFGRIRGDFDRALLSRNASDARRYLEEMRRSGRLTAEQSRFLEIRYLAGLGQLDQLARDHALIASIMELSLPAQTLTDVIHALYSTYVIPFEPAADMDAIAKVFKDSIWRPFGPLFRERKGVVIPEVLRAFLLYELCNPEPSLARIETMLHSYPQAAPGRALAEKFFQYLKPPQASRNVVAEVKQAIADEEYELAYGLAKQVIPDPWAYKALLRCAAELQSSDVIRDVLKLVTDAGRELLASLTQKDKQRLEQLKHAMTKPSRMINGWVDWARAVNDNPDSTPVASLLEKGLVTWSDEDFFRDGKQAVELARQIGNAKGPAEEVFREAFPYLVQFFVERPEKPLRNYAPIYLALVRLLAWADVASPDELRLGTSIMEALLGSGPNSEVYDEALDALLELLQRNGAPVNTDWAIDTSELLVRYPSPSPELRLRFFMQTVGLVKTLGQRVSVAQRTVLEFLAQDYSSPELVAQLPTPRDDEHARDADWGRFSGLIGLYSLSESSARRAVETLRTLLPSAKIELNADTAATERLRALAKHADIFVFAWKKSTHPAFHCVKDARQGRDLLMPAGGGAASLVRTVTEHLQSAQTGH
jgi:hypothetical protein